MRPATVGEPAPSPVVATRLLRRPDPFVRSAPRRAASTPHVPAATGQSRLSYAAWASSLANGERRAGARGASSSHSPIRRKFSALAVNRCCKLVFASPMRAAAPRRFFSVGGRNRRGRAPSGAGPRRTAPPRDHLVAPPQAPADQSLHARLGAGPVGVEVDQRTPARPAVPSGVRLFRHPRASLILCAATPGAATPVATAGAGGALQRGDPGGGPPGAPHATPHRPPQSTSGSSRGGPTVPEYTPG